MQEFIKVSKRAAQKLIAGEYSDLNNSSNFVVSIITGLATDKFGRRTKKWKRMSLRVIYLRLPIFLFTKVFYFKQNSEVGNVHK